MFWNLQVTMYWLLSNDLVLYIYAHGIYSRDLKILVFSKQSSYVDERVKVRIFNAYVTCYNSAETITTGNNITATLCVRWTVRTPFTVI
jgi:hypothetical protein